MRSKGIGPQPKSQLQVDIKNSGLQLNPRRNLFQLAVAAGFVAPGAFVGTHLAGSERLLGALLGIIGGLVSGTLASGLILMLLPAPIRRVPLDRLQRRYLRARRWSIWAAAGFFFFGFVFPIAGGTIVPWNGGWSDVFIVVWLLGYVTCCGISKGLLQNVKETCPRCSIAFRNVTCPCSVCGFSVGKKGKGS